MAAGQQAAMGTFLAFTRAQESSRRPGRRHISVQGGRQRQGQHRILQEAAEPGISPRDLRQGQLRPHPPAVERAHRRADRDLSEGSRLEPADRSGARGALPAGQGQADRLCRRPSRRSSIYPESDQSVPAHYARAYAYHLGAYPEKANAEADALLATAPERSLLPRAEGPDPARIRPARRGDRAAARGGRHAPDSR